MRRGVGMRCVACWVYFVINKIIGTSTSIDGAHLVWKELMVDLVDAVIYRGFC